MKKKWNVKDWQNIKSNVKYCQYILYATNPINVTNGWYFSKGVIFMEKRLIQINPELVIKKCDKCCASCDFLKDRGNWYQCLKDSKETYLSSYCSLYHGNG